MNELEQKLAELNKRYGADLGDRVEALELFLSEYVSSDSKIALEKLYKGAHALAGSARTFGFSDVSVVAKKLELSAREFDDAEILFARLYELKKLISS